MFWVLALTLSIGGVEAGHQSRPSFTFVDAGAQPQGSVPAAPPVCGPVVTFADGTTPERIRHVATTGSDTAGDGSLSRPFRTIPAAARAISPGTAIHVHAGTYNGDVVLPRLRGTEKRPIWIMGAPG